MEIETNHQESSADKMLGNDNFVNGSPDQPQEAECCDPRKGYYRFFGLIFLCFYGFGLYYCYDTPGALQNQITQDMGVNKLQFSSLYSLYSWPNVVLSFVGGFLIDRVFGIRMGAIIFSVIITMGQVVFALGALIDTFWVMQLGRFIFGIGGESLAVAQNTYTVAWFKGKELNTVFGLLLSMARIGSTVNFLTMNPIYSWIDTFKDGHVTLGISLMIAVITCIFSLICIAILGVMDKRRSRILCLNEVSTGEKIKLKDVLHFPLSFWLISIICVTYYVAVFPFIGLAKVFFMQKYNFGETKANGVSGIVYFISAVGSPLAGFIVDKTGMNIMWVFLSILITLGSHMLLAFTFVTPFVPMILIGIGYSLLASSLWPIVSLVLPDHQLGTAYGLMQSIQNLGLALISMLGGLIVDKKGYMCLEIFYILWLCLAIACSVGMWAVDGNREGYLMMTAKERKRFDEKQENELTTNEEEFMEEETSGISLMYSSNMFSY